MIYVTLILAIAATVGIVALVTHLYIVVKKFNRLKKFRESVAVGDAIQFYYPKHGLWTSRRVLKVGIEYVEVDVGSKRIVLHKNDIYPYE